MQVINYTLATTDLVTEQATSLGYNADADIDSDALIQAINSTAPTTDLSIERVINLGYDADADSDFSSSMTGLGSDSDVDSMAPMIDTGFDLDTLMPMTDLGSDSNISTIINLGSGSDADSTAPMMDMRCNSDTSTVVTDLDSDFDESKLEGDHKLSAADRLEVLGRRYSFLERMTEGMTESLYFKHFHQQPIELRVEDETLEMDLFATIILILIHSVIIYYRR